MKTTCRPTPAALRGGRESLEHKLARKRTDAFHCVYLPGEGREEEFVNRTHGGKEVGLSHDYFARWLLGALLGLGLAELSRYPKCLG